MIQHQVADHGVSHLLRGGDGGLAVSGGEALDFDDVAALIFQRSGHFVKRVLGFLLSMLCPGRKRISVWVVGLY